MVGSAHRKLRKVLVRKGLLEDREFSIGFGGGDLDPTDVIGQFFSSSIVEVPSQSSSKRDATVLPATSITLSSHTITSTSTSTSASVAKTTFAATSSTSLLIPSVASASTSNTDLIPSSTADLSHSSSTTSSGNIIGIVAAVIIAVLALSVFGFFILRQRRKNRNAKLILQVDPFRMGLSAEKELPPHPTTEQRMTFGAFYGRPGPGDNLYGEAQTELAHTQSTTYQSGSSVSTKYPQSLLLNIAASDEQRLKASGRSLTAAFGDSDSFHTPSDVASPAISPFVDPVVNPSPNVQIPLSAAVKHTPSYPATMQGSQIPISAYSPVTRRSYKSQSPSNVASAPPASDRHPPSEPGEQMRPGTIYRDEDVYGGI